MSQKVSSFYDKKQYNELRFYYIFKFAIVNLELRV